LCGTSFLRAVATDDVSPLRAQLSLAEEADDKPSIIELSRRIVAKAPNDSDAWDTLARTQLEIEDFDRFAETLDAWEKTTKKPPVALEDFRGDLCAHQRDYKNAARHYLAFLARKPSASDAADIYDKLADLSVDQGLWNENAAYRSKAIAAKASAARRVDYACALLRLHKWDAAYAEMAKANKLEPDGVEVKEWLPQFERLQEFLPRIKALEVRMAKSPNDFNLLLERAHLFALAQRPLLALDDCEKASKLEPQSMRARIQTAEALLDLKRDDDVAKLQVGKNLARDAAGHVTEQSLGELAGEDSLLAKNPADAEALASRSITLRQLNQYTLALADARAALAADDKFANAHFEMAHDLAGLGQAAEANTHIVKATELAPTNAVMWYYRGVLEAERANFLSAIESQTRSLAIRESAVALKAREEAERRIGKVQEAETDLRRFNELEPARQ
jgi:tetratricopeptide (TPR) repeat protein